MRIPANIPANSAYKFKIYFARVNKTLFRGARVYENFANQLGFYAVSNETSQGLANPLTDKGYNRE